MKRDICKPSLVDIHTHILPGIDDGPASVVDSLRLLYEEKRQGVTHIVLTPHFDMGEEKLESFFARREEAYRALQEALRAEPALGELKLYKGAEVRYDPNMVFTSPDPLCIEGTRYMLLELTNDYPFNVETTVNWLTSKGITPIIAHAERYDYLRENKKLVQTLLEMGAIFQCNASAMLSPLRRRNVKKLQRMGAVHIFASDTHSVDKRPPLLGPLFEKLKKRGLYYIANARQVLD